MGRIIREVDFTLAWVYPELDRSRKIITDYMAGSPIPGMNVPKPLG